MSKGPILVEYPIGNLIAVCSEIWFMPPDSDFGDWNAVDRVSFLQRVWGNGRGPAHTDRR